MTIAHFTTGSPELDRLLEELRAGDNVVFYVDDSSNYAPFVVSAICHPLADPRDLVYLRLSGFLDPYFERLGGQAHVIDLADSRDVSAMIGLVLRRAQEIGQRVFYIVDPLDDLISLGASMAEIERLFLAICPFLFKLDTVAYWCQSRGGYTPNVLAAIKDCTQVFVQVEGMQSALGSGGRRELVITPVKVWGRYSEAMFRPHRVWVDPGYFDSDDVVPALCPLPMNVVRQDAYTEALADKNRELAELRDALGRSNRALLRRNRDLTEANDELANQNRLYRQLQENLDRVLTLVQVQTQISASLVLQQVREAVAEAARHLFGADAIRLAGREDGSEPQSTLLGDGALFEGAVVQRALQAAHGSADGEQHAACKLLEDGLGSVAVAHFAARGARIGAIELVSRDERLVVPEVVTMLGHLALDAAMALDNAYLFGETEVQGRQLRTYLDNVILSEEQDSRRFALDLHDGLVQLIVASFQHLQTAQALRSRDERAERRELDQGMRILRQAIYEARRIISQLRPAGLDDFGLVHALRIHVAQIQQQQDWTATLEVDPSWPERSPAALEAALFRIVQEATSNAAKYSGSSRLLIQLAAVGQSLTVRIQDWGQGFSPSMVLSEPERGVHIGLIGIRERARLLGGECHIESMPGQGATVTVVLPRQLAALTEDSTQ